jgi:hypothetical protein
MVTPHLCSVAHKRTVDKLVETAVVWREGRRLYECRICSRMLENGRSVDLHLSGTAHIERVFQLKQPGHNIEFLDETGCYVCGLCDTRMQTEVE